MDDSWKHLDAVLERFAPAIHAGLRPPASEAQIASAEKAMRVRLPEDVRAAYRWHDGCVSELSMFVSGCQWCSLDAMVEHWRQKRAFCQTDRHTNPRNYPAQEKWWDDLAAKPVWWNERWIPVGLSNTVSSFYVDLDPAPAGRPGQLIADSGMQEALVVSPSLGTFLKCLGAHLEAGRLSAGADNSWGVVGDRGMPVWWSQFDWTSVPQP